MFLSFVVIDGNPAAERILNRLLGKRSLLIVRNGCLPNTVALHDGAKCTQDDGQGSDIERGHLLSQDLRQTCECIQVSGNTRMSNGEYRGH